MNPYDLVRRYPDLALGVVLAAVNVVSLLQFSGQLHPLWGAMLLVAFEALPLAFRRRYPLIVMTVIGACRISYDAIGYTHAPFPLGVAIALYTVFDRSGTVWRWITFLLTLVGLPVSLTSQSQDEPYTAIYQALILGTAMVAGLLSRSRRSALAATSSRALRAEAALDEVAREQAAAERARIARELHDVIAHHISLVAVQSEASLTLLPDRPAEAEKSVAIIGDTARGALTELRRLLGVLRRPSDPLETLPSASLSGLDGLVDSVRSSGLAVTVSVTGSPFPLAAGVDLAAYRIIQEALTNTLRHSQAASALVCVGYAPGSVAVRVTEAGLRSGPLLTGYGSGLGLAGIAERVAACGGSLTIGPGADGFEVVATLPSP